MTCRPFDCSYLAFKWLNMPVVVPSSWLTSNKKVSCLLRIDLYRKIGNKEPYKSGYWEIANCIYFTIYYGKHV